MVEGGLSPPMLPPMNVYAIRVMHSLSNRSSGTDGISPDKWDEQVLLRRSRLFP
jgi:hypothetical protein